MRGDRLTLNRRSFIRTTALAGACLAQAGALRAAQRVDSGDSTRLIDVNVTLMRCPMRRLDLDEQRKLARKLSGQGVTEAWAGSFEALLARDLAGVNARLAQACGPEGGPFLPFGSVNPVQSWWREDLRRCHEEHRMAGVRLYPGYHGYKLDDPGCVELLNECAERKLIVQLVATIEDERVQHPVIKAAPVDLKPLPAMLKSQPGLRLVLLNWNRALNAKLVPSLASTGRVWVDIATQEGVGGVEKLFKQVPAGSVVFGSHAPYYYFESALLKLRESDLSDADTARIRHQNAAELRKAV